MAGYIGTRASVVSPGAERKKTFAITTTTTNLTGLSYTPGFVHVYHNGIRLVDSTDYTATDGSTITLTTAAENGDEVVVVSYGTFSPAYTYNKTESDDRYVNASGDTMTGELTVNNDAATVLTVDRKTSDGDIAVFQKDGTTVGSIGTVGGYSTIGSGDTGLIFHSGDDAIYGWDTSTNTARGSAIDLGTNTRQFKDLYLSGGVYVGGTGAANYLDDYEEGTWTPSFAVNGFTQTISSASGTYTKVGRQVTVTWKATLSSSGYMSGYSLISNLPFTVFSSQSSVTGFYGTGDIALNIIGSSGYFEGSTAYLYLYPSISTSNSTTWMGTHTYFTA